ncbi:MAG: histone acetylation protein-domain-containing protein [Piptocephalis tieghemiana]|nr:MAG: histone acetylation protein-domain-containing protein [Piptocephalis tieghemiana]
MIHEYAVQDTLVIYIEKVDTTGRWAPGSIGLRQGLSPSVALIQGYLAYIQSLSIPTHVYVFALPRPQYLFANSTDYPGKRVISDTGLIRWWQRLLTPLVHEPGVTGFVLTPGDTLKFPSRWQRGLGRASGSELARDVLALFPDDPIHRALQSEAAEGLSISEFIELLPVTEECGSGKRTGVFNIYLPGASPCKLPEASGDPKVSERMMHSLLQEAMFDTRQHAEEWSKRILAPLEGSDDKESSTMRIRIPGGIFDAEAWTRIKKLRGGQQVNQEVNILQPKKRSMEGHVNELLSQKKSFLKKEDSGNEAQAKETCESMNEL